MGLHVAYLAQRDGAQVAVVEAAEIASGTTGYSTAKLTSQHGFIYDALETRHTVEVAEQYATANVAGIDLVTGLVDELGISCDLTRAPAWAYTLEPTRRDEVASEADAARRLGLPAHLDETIDLPFEIAAAVRFDGQYHLDPVRYLNELAEAFVSAGGTIYEHSRATSVDELRDQSVNISVERISDRGLGHSSVRANQAVVTTLLPLGSLGGYFAKTRPIGAYGIAVRLRNAAPAGMTIQIEPPNWSTRPWLAAGPTGMIVVGNGHQVGKTDDAAYRSDELAAWTHNTFEVETIEHRWFAHDYSTPDLLPYVGYSPTSTAILVATGFRKWGLSNGAAAALMLTDHLAGRENSWAAPFNAGRIGDAKAVGKLVTGGFHVGKEFIAGRLGNDHPTCTHLGCPLHWNAPDSTWDCYCHGSRFDSTGAVLTGPAVNSLKLDTDK
ncbi:glycine/D-amino acid oxidase-like deaminating enzyme [Tenggerimyces flavus]|nr:glycine/D-amino acid oxidase-like deaminating enzyme [Tenggerimyces flavus]